MQHVKTALAAAVLSLGLAVSATAMPVQRLSTELATPHVDQVRLVCNRWGRCWHVHGYGYGYGWHHGWYGHRHWRHGW